MIQMQGVYIEYWVDGVATMIFASDSADDPQDKYKTNGAASRDLVDEVLRKIQANNKSGKPIRLCIKNNWIVPDSQCPAATTESTALAAAPNALVGVALSSATAAPKGAAAKKTPAKKAAPRAAKAPTKEKQGSAALSERKPAQKGSRKPS